MLQGKTAIVTGSSRGIGETTVIQLAKNGANVIAHARKKTDEFESKCKNLNNNYNIPI